MDIQIHFIRDFVANDLVKLEYYSSNEQVADILTKSLPCNQHVYS